ncbi:hypothetical protein AK812_SmicGene31113 [Symbiodinium microadriaticum]|uniref:Uncharacterized protein n=1 Tax=Symbiodinium microadriaticum TaxID=2951 RepID=A0A1Q9CXK9_SYMMI|nr:hypothetical protein AK812_SmicGene31113 [Symbiodinium microadriaticum]
MRPQTDIDAGKWNGTMGVGSDDANYDLTVQQHKAEQLQDGEEYRYRLMEIKGTAAQKLEVVRQVHSTLEFRGRDAGSAANPVAGGYPTPGMSGLGLGLVGALSANRSPPGAGFGAGAFASSLSNTSDLGQLTLQIAMPNEEVSRIMASESSGIARRAGVRLSAARGAGGLPVLKVSGTAVANSVACYLIQDRLYLMQ